MTEQEKDKLFKRAIWPKSAKDINGPKATGLYVWIIRDETKTEHAGLLIPGAGREKPQTGTIHSFGDKITDKDIKSRERAIFHKGVGQEIDYGGQIYLVMQEHEIIGTDD